MIPIAIATPYMAHSGLATYPAPGSERVIIITVIDPIIITNDIPKMTKPEKKEVTIL